MAYAGPHTLKTGRYQQERRNEPCILSAITLAAAKNKASCRNPDNFCKISKSFKMFGVLKIFMFKDIIISFAVTKVVGNVFILDKMKRKLQ